MYPLVRKALFAVDAEGAHGFAVRAAKLAQATVPGLLGHHYRYHSQRLAQTLWNVDIENPIGLAAGFDKNAELLRFWRALGFGFVEVGSVTARPSPGNPRPRAFRLPADRALINRMGLNNDGAEVIAQRLQRLRRRPPSRRLAVGVNLAKTHDPELLGRAAIDDFCQSFRATARFADYVAINVSCPNTREGKTFEEPRALDELLAAIMGERTRMSLDVPVLIKLSPPPPAPQPIPGLVGDVVSLALARGVHGFIACNTAPDRVGLSTPRDEVDALGRGGLSGAPLAERSNRLIRYLYRRLQGQVPIIGVGGVTGLDDVTAKLEAGANLVELYTGMVYEGPSLASRLARELDRWLEERDVSHVGELVGSRCDDG